MIGRLKDSIGKRGAFDSLEQEVFLTLLHTADALGRPFDELFRGAGLSPTQYNVLRILRGAGRDGLACSQIGGRMITRDPDMTRMLDRLQKRRLITRKRQSDDRRVVKAFVTSQGLTLLVKLDEPVRRLHVDQFAHVNRQRLQMLLDLLHEVRS